MKTQAPYYTEETEGGSVIYSKYNGTDQLTSLQNSDDAAYYHTNGEGRMPTLTEITELVNNTTVEWTTYNNVAGAKVIGPNGNSIFIPAAGCSMDGSPSQIESLIYLFCTALNEYAANYDMAYTYRIRYDEEYGAAVTIDTPVRYLSCSIRAVK